RLGGISFVEQYVGRSEQPFLDYHVIPPIKIERGKGGGQEALETVGLSCGDDEVVRRLVLKNPPHGVDIFWRPTPIALDSKIAKSKFGLTSGLDARGGTGNLARDKALRPKRRLVIGKNAIGGE